MFVPVADHYSVIILDMSIVLGMVDVSGSDSAPSSDGFYCFYFQMALVGFKSRN
jgi:hypothetical protein